VSGANHRHPANLSRACALALLATTSSALICSGAACSRSDPEPRPAPIATEPKAVATEPPASASAAAAAPALPAGPLVLARGVRIVHAGPGSDAARVVMDERAHARSDGRDLVVYVGAKWCEPCQFFHKAAQRGELDAEFPDLTILEFDLDEDRDRLATAGYVSQFIPLFAMPGPDGRASDKKFEGSVKGGGAVANIAPRLRTLLRK
jgi:thiol-disulfide isomerase/thioredoxin